jgi:hydrogenase maturation protein HypF
VPTTRFASSSASVATPRRTRVRVHGTVQGVGFRPYVYRLADELGLAGWVLNDARGVLLEVEGGPQRVDAFLDRLTPDAPPLAIVERVETSALAPLGERSFAIRESPRGEVSDAPVTPDTATCADCLRELFDPHDRRYRYPFINCTNCGPRFTIVCGVPYDRPLTTMAGFEMCTACRAEYEDPSDRRFHAQPNACPECGPAVRLIDPHGVDPHGVDPHDSLGPGDHVLAAATALRDGAIVAVKGIGGFHLACRADNEAAVSALRARKHREDKPFALMVATADDAAALVELSEVERVLLCSPQRPIVLAARRDRGTPGEFSGPTTEKSPSVAKSVAPGAPELGVMLPYSPLHHLLLADAGGTLVMTSGNMSDEPIAYGDEDALARLAAVADLLLVHNRPIETRTDDSVVRAVAAPDPDADAGRDGDANGDGNGQPSFRPMFMRRSRGYVPASIPLPDAAARPILACGAELKSTFCLAKGSRAWISHHIGDLQNYETLRSFTDGIEHFKRLFSVQPQVVVHDLHPEYLSTKYALELQEAADTEVRGSDHGLGLIAVQHHHAHLAASLAEHGESGIAVGAIFDGTGYGSDGTLWGGELLVGDLAGFQRAGALRPVRLPGGERAIREPWRMACAWLTGLHGGEPPIPAALRTVDKGRWRLITEMTRTGLNSPVTTSMGRLFDAVAALCGIRAEVNYEGQAAIELEAACDPGERGSYEVSVSQVEGRIVIDPLEALRALIADVERGTSVRVVASRFHAGIAAATVVACTAAAAAAGTETVVLSGGVFQNRRLLEATAAGLHAAGLRVLMPQLLPPGDGGISYGQTVIAARRLAR